MTFVEQVADTTGWRSTAQYDRVADDSAGNTSVDHEEAFLSRSRRSALLSRMVEAEILPRLTIAHGAAAAQTELATRDEDTVELVRLLMGQEEGGAWTFIQSLELRGATPASLYLGIVTQAARRLGELWEDDRCDFAQVTISLGRLQQVVRALSPEFQAAAVKKSAHADTVLLLPAPGEQHTIGLIILGEFFQRDGWHVLGGPVSTGCDAASIVHESWIDVAGFSVASMGRVDGLAASIRAVRRASRNRHLAVMVGGPLFLQHPDLVTRVGADTTATDAPGAVRQAKGMLALRAAAD